MFKLDPLTVLSSITNIPNYVFTPVLEKNVLILNFDNGFNVDFSKVLKKLLDKYYSHDFITNDEYYTCKSEFEKLIELLIKSKDNTLLFNEYKSILNNNINNIQYIDSYFLNKNNNNLFYISVPDMLIDVISDDILTYIMFSIPASNWRQVGNYFYKN